jgi:hypothetical protein
MAQHTNSQPAYQLGWDAYHLGLSLPANPYDWADSAPFHNHTIWNDGWIAAQNDDTPAGHLHKMLGGSVSMETCLAAQDRL